MNAQSEQKIIFFVKSLRFLRYFKSVLLEFLRRGFYVMVAFDPVKVEQPSDDSLDKLSSEFPNFRWVNGPLRKDAWSKIIIPCRNILNYRFLLRKTTSRRHINRLFAYLPSFFKFLVKYGIGDLFIRSALIGFVCRVIEKVVPPDKTITKFISDYSPSAVLVSYRSFPCSSPDIDYVKSGLALKIPTTVIVPSWDQPTTKSLIQLIPDKVFVWNSEHEKAIVDYHQIPRSRISISGAPQFDQWFDRKGPSVSKEQFCSAIGVSPESLLILYIASSSAGARNSDAIKAIREAMDTNNNKLIREAVLVVRPYPGIEKHSEVVGYQKVANLPAPAESRRTLNDDLAFFDAIYYSLVTIAVDSTAFIDSMVIDRPCIVYNDPKFFDVQNAEHFALILQSGALYHARSANEIAEFCASIIQSGDTQSLARKKYIENLIRPRGLERSVGEIIVDEVERLI